MRSRDLRHSFDEARSEEARLVDEAEWIAEGIVHIERSFAPRTTGDSAERQVAIAGAWRQPAKSLCSLVHAFEVAGREVQVFEIGSRRRGVSVRRRIVQRQDYPTASKVMASGRDARAGLLKELCIETGPLFDVSD